MHPSISILERHHCDQAKLKFGVCFFFSLFFSTLIHVSVHAQHIDNCLNSDSFFLLCIDDDDGNDAGDDYQNMWGG